MKRKSMIKQRGIAMLAALAFIAIFSAFSVGVLSLASANLQVSDNHHKANMALNAAQSGLECARYVAVKTTTLNTIYNDVSVSDAEIVWDNLCSQLQTTQLGSLSVPGEESFSDAYGSGTQIVTQSIPYGDNGSSFQIRFYKYDSDPKMIHLQSTGEDGGLDRTVQMDLKITKDATVLQYALAGRGRMWLTGDTTIHGSIYSSWDRADISPFNMTSDSKVEGTINTVLDLDDILAHGYQMETLNADDNPMFAFGVDAYDAEGNPVSATYGPADTSGYLMYTDEHGNLVHAYNDCGMPIAMDFNNRVYSSGDEIQGYHENINYDQVAQEEVPGLDIGDYDTSTYKSAIPATVVSAAGSVIENGILSTSVPTQHEYFPHAAGSYTTRASSSSLSLYRHVYENKTIRNVVVDAGNQALFKNCTFEDVLYIDTRYSGPSMNSSSTYNNIRFENCTFNGTIVTNTPQSLNSGWWMCNNLYFTGAASFNNTSSHQEATILAPHFNVNIGNTNPEQSENNVLTGAIVGGIVDVRGNAQIYGTIISMADTTNYPSGYVTNIGVTLEDGGSETTEAGDIGVIEITPDEEKMLPSGIKTPIVLKPVKGSYEETI